MGTVKVKTLEQTKAKWVNSIGKVTEAYKIGVESVNDFKARAIAGQALYAQQMANPTVLARREKMLNKMSDSKWKDNAKLKGSVNIITGMNAAKDDYGKGMADVLAVAASVDLPVRGIGTAANIQRVQLMAQAQEDAAKRRRGE